MKKLLLILVLLVSGYASAQEGGFYWVGEDEALLNGVRYTQVGTFFDDFANTQVVERTIEGYIVRFERINGGWTVTRVDGVDTATSCRYSYYIYIDQNGEYNYWAAHGTPRLSARFTTGSGSYEEYFNRFLGVLDAASYRCATSGS